MIPQCNPKAGYLEHKQEIDNMIARVLDSGWYILGKEVEAFEDEFAAWLGVKHAVGVANGTDAIELALRAAGIGIGDHVATVSHTAVATVSAIRRCGSIPVFVDIEPDYFVMDADSLEAVFSMDSSIKAVVVVHLYGQMANMPRILDFARIHDLVVIEDCAQAHGAALNGRKAGTWGDFGCFSFYPTKNLGALGDGGAVVSNDSNMAGKLCALRQYGWDDGRISQIDGVNSRLDELQAAVLRVRLKFLDEDNKARRRISAVYRSGLEAISELKLPTERENSEHVYHQFVMRLSNRNDLIDKLAQEGIRCAVHYLHPVHLHPAFGYKVSVPVSLIQTEIAVSEIISLPMFPELTDKDASQVVTVINRNVNL